MRKVILFIAMSLDGYLADREGNVDWIGGHGKDDEMMDTYADFITGVDTVVMGFRTYDQVVTQLSPDQWVYSGLNSYVVTHRDRFEDCPFQEMIHFTNEDPCSLVKKLRQTEGKQIWICGGAQIIQQLMEEDLIDLYEISVIPILLGKGIRLFGQTGKELPLRLVRTQSYNGITELLYERRKVHVGVADAG